MSLVDFGQIAIASIISAGGIGAIIVGTVHFSANLIADRLSKKYEAKLIQENEKYKSEISKKEYVSKTRFDTEFQIYRDLSIAYFDLLKAINSLIPCGFSFNLADEKERDELENQILANASKLSVAAQDTLNRNAPFIPEQFYEAYDAILKKCFMQIDVIREKYNIGNLCPDKGKPKPEDYKRTQIINEEFKENNNNVRKYLASLDVVE